MPNWCENEVEIYCSSPKETKEVEEFLSGEIDVDVVLSEGEVVVNRQAVPLSFASIIPMPDDKWDYDWCYANWGCKWEPCSVTWNVIDNEIHCKFLTPWCPPEGICSAIRDEFPEVTVNWFYRADADELAGWL